MNRPYPHNNLPTLTVARDARKYVDDYYFDTHTYAQYLYDRKVDEQDIARLSLIVTEKRLDGDELAAYFSPGYKSGRHTIRFSPKRMPLLEVESGSDTQGATLRHETEHFILDAQRSLLERDLDDSRREKAIMIGAAVCAVSFGHLAYQVSDSLMSHAPELARVSVDTFSALAIGAIGRRKSQPLLTETLNYYHPDELQAYRAEESRKDQLPDDIMRIEFAENRSPR